MSDPKQSPEGALLSFFSAMRDWERVSFDRFMDHMNERINRDDTIRANHEELEAIFEKFCTSTQRPDAHRVGSSPTQYDPDEEKILEVKEGGNKATILTECTNDDRFTGKWMYILVKEDDGWKIDERREFRNGKYKKTDL